MPREDRPQQRKADHRKQRACALGEVLQHLRDSAADAADCAAATRARCRSAAARACAHAAAAAAASLRSWSASACTHAGIMQMH